MDAMIKQTDGSIWYIQMLISILYSQGIN